MNTDKQIEELERELAQYKEALKEEAHMSEIEEQLAKAHGHVRQAEIIMAELGHKKYSLSGMCSAAMRHDLEQEVSKLLRKLANMTKQRDALAEALQGYLEATESGSAMQEMAKLSGRVFFYERLRECRKIAEQALAATKGGSDE
jgi:chromosome segregation ATPase